MLFPQNSRYVFIIFPKAKQGKKKKKKEREEEIFYKKITMVKVIFFSG